MSDRPAGADLVDADLIRQTARGDRDAFAEIYRRHHARIFRFARLMTGRSSVAEDVVQEVFLTLMRDASRYDPSQAALSTYLFGIARHQTRRRLARDKRFVALERTHVRGMTGSPAESAEARLSRRNDLERLRIAILGLPSRYREVIVMCDLEDIPYTSAAETLRCPIGTVRSRLHRARRLLARALNERAVPEPGAAPVLRPTSRVRCAT